MRKLNKHTDIKSIKLRESKSLLYLPTIELEGLLGTVVLFPFANVPSSRNINQKNKLFKLTVINLTDFIGLRLVINWLKLLI